MNLSIELINKILSYLSDKPFNEVNGLVGQIMLEVKKDREKNQQEFTFSPDNIEVEDTKNNVAN